MSLKRLAAGRESCFGVKTILQKNTYLVVKRLLNYILIGKLKKVDQSEDTRSVDGVKLCYGTLKCVFLIAFYKEM